jgi:hypothetical protein
MKGINSEYFFGTIVAIPDSSDSFVVKVNIPKVFENLTCYPFRNSSDEPKIGDLVVIRDLDPEYHSYFVYEKLNENDFTGIRCKGKMIDLTDDSIKLGIFDEGDFSDGDRPGNTSWIELNEDGKLDIKLEDNLYLETGGSLFSFVDENLISTVEQNASIEIGGHTTVNIKCGEDVIINGKVNLTINGDYSLKVTGTLDIDANDIKISGHTLKLNTAEDTVPGPFNSCMTCFQAPGLVHGTNKIFLKRG